MWFVLATAKREEIVAVIRAIEEETTYPVLDLPRLDEYFIELKLSA
jgi:hypothetical protein